MSLLPVYLTEYEVAFTFIDPQMRMANSLELKKVTLHCIAKKFFKPSLFVREKERSSSINPILSTLTQVALTFTQVAG